MKKILRNKIFLALGLVILGVAAYFGIKILNGNNVSVIGTEMYIAGTTSKINLYDLEFKQADTIPRGTKVKIVKKNVVNEQNKQKFSKIKYNKKDYLVLIDSLVTELKDTVLEKTLYVRTPFTIYKDSESGKILSMAKKGSELEILGFDKLNDDGEVNLYQIKYNDLTGYAYGKYMVNTKEEALKNYDEEGNYKIHAKRTDTQGGGSAANLDFYPYKKPKFEDNVMPEEVRSLYLNTGVVRYVDEYIKLAKSSNINAFVVDIKDNQSPGYYSPVMKEMSPTNYKNARNSFTDYQNAIKKIKDAGFYVIGRITVFKDSYYVSDHPEDAIVESATNQPFKHNSSYWPTAFSRDVWEFNVELAKEAVREMGFNEIQFDYVRFPDRTYNLEKMVLLI